MRDFRKPFDEDHTRCFTHNGSRFRDKNVLVYDRSGGKHLEKVGEEDLFEIIQSHRDSVDLKKILERCMMTGDVSALNQRQGIYTDTTTLPNNARDYHQILINAEAIYNGLVDDVKESLDFNSFLETFASPSALRSLIESRKAEKEVEANES